MNFRIWKTAQALFLSAFFAGTAAAQVQQQQQQNCFGRSRAPLSVIDLDFNHQNLGADQRVGNQ